MLADLVSSENILFTVWISFFSLCTHIAISLGDSCIPGVSFSFLKDTSYIKSDLHLESHLTLVYLFQIPVTNTEWGWESWGGGRVRDLALVLTSRQSCVCQGPEVIKKIHICLYVISSVSRAFYKNASHLYGLYTFFSCL